MAATSCGVASSVIACLMLVSCTAATTYHPAGERKTETVAYQSDVEPILRAQCTGCHREGGSGPFALDGYAQARSHAQEIATVTRARRMPPWPPVQSDDCPQLLGARGLREREIAVLEAWAANGAPEGKSLARADAAVREQPVAELRHVDAVLQASEPYVPRPEVDDHRCFAVDPGLDEDRYLTAYAVRMDVPGIVHHVQLWALDDEAAESDLDALDAADPGIGYDCAQGHELSARYVSVWAPSEPVRRHPEGTGVLLHAGRRMVIQIHYHDRLGLELPDQTRVELELADSVEYPASLWTFSTADILLPPGEADISVRVQSAVPAESPVRLWGVRPHMHALGRSAGLAVLRGDAAQCLLSVPRWDPAWQLMYFYAQPIELDPTDTLEVDCSYDTRGQSAPVRYGIRTEDEMCFGYFYVTQ